MQHPADNQPPLPQSEPDNIIWLDIRYEGDLICRVNANDRTHIEFLKRQHGQKRIVRVSTTTLGVTGCKAV
jgi:hypothetical protein